MKAVKKITAALCVMLLSMVSCRDDLFELAGDHDISVIYSDDISFTQPPATYVRKLSGGRVEIEGPGTVYFRVSNASSDTVELLSIEWINWPLVQLSFGSLPPFPATPQYDFTIDYTGTDDETGVIRIVYRTGGSSTRELFIVVEGYM